MKKASLAIAILVIAGLLFTAYSYWLKSNSKIESSKEPAINERDTTAVSEQSRGSAEEEYVIYSEQHFPFTFQIPSSFKQQGKAAEVVNPRNEVMAVNAAFTDTLTKASLTIEYHLPPNGSKLYEFSLSQFNASQGWYEKGKEKIKVAGSDALVANEVLTVNGKGQALRPPVRSMVVDFLDKKQRGEVQLQFKCSEDSNSNAEIAKFRRLLSTVQFTD